MDTDAAQARTVVLQLKYKVKQASVDQLRWEGPFVGHVLGLGARWCWKQCCVFFPEG